MLRFGKKKTDAQKLELNLKGNQSVFVVFRKPASKADHPISVVVSDSTANWNVQSDKNGNAVIVQSLNRLEAKVFYASGKEKTINTNPKPATEISGTWKVSFVPKTDQTFELDFPELIDFSKHSNRAVNYFCRNSNLSKNHKY